MREIKGFISYSHEDTNYFEKFKKLFDGVIKSDKKAPYQITMWSDRQILAGQEWHKVIQESLKDCDFIILLVSNDFFGSNYVEKQEFAKAKNLNKLIIPVELTQVIDRNQFEGLGKVQWFTYTKFSKGETFGSRLDSHGNDKAWQSEFINKFYLDLIAFLKETVSDGNPPETTTDNKIHKVKELPHIKAFLDNKPVRVLKTVAEDDLVVIASNRMKKSNIRHLLVLSEKGLVGMLSRRDIVKLERDDKYKNNNVVLSSSRFKTTKVSKIMIKNVLTCNIEDDIAGIVERFADKQPIGNGKKASIGTLAVKKETETIEIVSYTDILMIWKSILSNEEVSKLVSLSAGEIMKEEQEIQRLNEDDILAFGYDMVTDEADPRRAIPIVSSKNDRILRGMISDLRVFSVHNDANEIKPIKDFMREKGVDLNNFFSKETDFESMVETFREEKDLTSLPVVEGDEIIGIVSYTDLLKKISEQIKFRTKTNPVT